MRKLCLFFNSPWQIALQRGVVNSSGNRLISSSAKLSKEKNPDPPAPVNPMRRTLQILGKDFKFLKQFVPERFREPQTKTEDVDEQSLKNLEVQEDSFQTHCDVLIIGGGGVGSSIAYWLKKKARDGLNVVVIDKDATYSKASAVQYFHGLNQHFSLPENIQMSLYAADFIRDGTNHLGGIDLNYTPYGSLILATENDAEVLQTNSKIQSEMGVRSELLTPEQIKSKFPWLNTEDIVLGWHGLEREGWFDPIALLFGYQKKARGYGAHFVEGEVLNFEFQAQQNISIVGEEPGSYQSLDKAVVRMPNGETRTIKFAICVIAAGSSSGDIGRLARIGNGPGMLSIAIPVEQRRRYAYLLNVEGEETPSFSTPLTFDPNGTYFRHEGLSGNYICGRNFISQPSTDESIGTEQNIFDNEILPTLKNRITGLKSAEVKKSWTDLYEYNTFDENGIVGAHPYYTNLYLAVGFNGQGIQQTPAVGRGISELIIDGRYRTIDLTRLGFDRLVVDQPLYEMGIIF